MSRREHPGLTPQWARCLRRGKSRRCRLRPGREFTRATLDEALSAIRTESSVEIEGAEPVRIVSTARIAPRKDAPSGGPPAGFALKRVEVRDLLAGIADVTPGSRHSAPRDSWVA